jgi:hypothetical protein
MQTRTLLIDRLVYLGRWWLPVWCDRQDLRNR